MAKRKKASAEPAAVTLDDGVVVPESRNPEPNSTTFQPYPSPPADAQPSTFAPVLTDKDKKNG